MNSKRNADVNVNVKLKINLNICNYVPPTMGGGGGAGGGHIVFSADPVGVATCLHSISLLNGQILAKLTYIYHWRGKMLIRFR